MSARAVYATYEALRLNYRLGNKFWASSEEL